MARFVKIEIVARQMAQFAPPAWCKLAIYGAIHTERVRVFAASGRFRAYLPGYYLVGHSNLPALVRPRRPENIAERYGLDLTAIDTSSEVTLWEEHWTDEPKHIAVGWVIFAEPWDWVAPSLAFEFFEIPSDYAAAFEYDDLHSEGEPDTALFYESSFEGLCLEIADAEAIAPMCDFEPHAFGSKTATPTKGIGRPKGSGFLGADEPLVREMVRDKRNDPSLSARALAEKYVDRAVGHGTRESRLKRLERRLSDYGV